MMTIHGRVWRAAAFVTGGALLITGAIAYLLIRDDLTDDLDNSLFDWAKLLAGQVDDEDAARMEFRGTAKVENGRAFVIRDHAGRILAQGGDQDLVATAVPPIGIPTDASTKRANEVRIVRTVISPEADEVGMEGVALVEVTVSQDLDALDKSLTGIGAALLIACMGASVLVAAILGRVTRRALRPVNALSSSIARIDPLRLPTAMEVVEVPGELLPVVTQLDALLARLAASWEHERAFSAAASHELRTPLAGLRMILDVSLARERDAASLRAAMGSCQAIAAQMERIVSSLLLLSRADAGTLVPRMEAVDLAEVVGNVWKDVAATPAAAGRHADLDLPPQALVRSGPDLAAMLVRVLLDNAVAHGSPGEPIRVSLAPWAEEGGSGAWVLAIANAGCLLAPEEVPHVFDRFWRGDRARSADEGHAGLGLSIARTVSRALGADLRVAVAGGWFTATVGFPADPPSPSHEDP